MSQKQPVETTVEFLASQHESLPSASEETAAAEPVANSEMPQFASPSVTGEIGRLGKYRIQKELGRGGMGAVYLAFDERLQRQIALKVMLPKFAANANAKDRFLREARAAARISSDHVVNIHEADEIDGTAYIALQLLQGYPLDEYLKKKGSPSLPQIIRIGREMAIGLAAAHKLGLVHRDIKPGNVWLEAPNGRVKILDFGLAKPVEGTESAELTAMGSLVGTPAYMAPEQGRGQTLDGRADLFSLGCVLYRLCTGKLPFARPTLMSILIAVATEEPTPVRELNPNVPEPLADLIRRLMAKNATDRPANAQAVMKEFDGIIEPTQKSAEVIPHVFYAPMAVSMQQINPFADIDTVTDPETAEPHVEVAKLPPRKFPAILVGSLLFALIAIVLAGFIVIKITNKDGSISELKVSKDAKIEVDGKTVATGPKKPEPLDKLDPLPSWTPPKPIPVGESPFDKLDANAIPKEERFDWQPKELVGVIGTHARRHWLPVAAVAMSDDGTKAATVSFAENTTLNRDVIVWDVATQKPLRRFQLPTTRFAERLQFHANDTQLYVFGVPSIQLWDIAADPPKRLNALDQPKIHSRFSGWLLEGGKTFCGQAAHEGWGLMALFAIDDKGMTEGELRKINEKNGAYGSHCVVSAKTDHIYYPDVEGKLRRAKVKDAKLTEDEELPIQMLQNDFPRGLSPDGKLLAVADEKGLAIWDVSVKVPTERGRILGRSGSVVFSPCSRWLLIGQIQNTGRDELWQLGGPEPKFVATVNFDHYSVGGSGFSRDGNRLVVADDQGFVRFWDLSGAEPKELSAFDPGTAFRPLASAQCVYTRLSRTSGEVMLARYDLDPKLKSGRWQAWAFDGPKPGPSLAPDQYLCLPVSAGNYLLPATNGKWVSSPCESDWKARLHGVVDGRWQPVGEPFGETSPRGYLSQDGKTYLAMVDGEKTAVEGWDVSGESIRKWTVPRDRKGAWREDRVVASSQDGSRFAFVIATKPNWIDLAFGRSTGAEPGIMAPRPIDCQTSWYIGSMSPDGSRYVHSQTTQTHEPEVLDITGKEPKVLGKLPAILGIVHWLSYSPDGKHFAAAGDRGLAVFDAATLKPVWAWAHSPGPISWVDWVADGRHLVCHNGNKTLYVLRVTEAVGPKPPTKEVRESVGDDWIDLNALDESWADPVVGSGWHKTKDGKWVSALTPNWGCQLALPLAPKGSYDLEAEATLDLGTDTLLFQLPVGDRAVGLRVNSFSGSKAGLSQIDGEFLITPQAPLAVGRRIKFAISIRLKGDRAEIKATVDGIKPILWEGPLASLSRNPDSQIAEDQLGVVTWSSQYTLHTLRFKKIDGTAEIIKRVPLDAK